MTPADAENEHARVDLPESESVVSGAVLTALAQGMTLVSAILLGAIVGRTLGPEGKGALSAIRQLFTVILDSGSLGVVRASHFFLGKRRHALGAVIGSYSLVFFSGLTLAASVVVVLTVLRFEPMLTMLSGADLKPEVGLPLLLALTLVGGGYFLYRGLLQGLAQFRAMNVPQIAVTSCQLLATGLLALLGELTVVRAILVLIAVQTLGALMAGRSLVRQGPVRPSISRRVAGEAIRYGRPLWLVEVTGLLLVRTDILIVGGVFGAAELGSFSVAAALAELLWFAPQVIWVSTFRRIAEREKQEGIELTQTITYLSIIVTIAASIALGIAAYPFVRILYGVEFLSAVPLFFVLLPGYAAQAALGQYSIYLVGSLGRPTVDVAVTGSCAVLKLLLAFVFIRWVGLGVWGVALATTLAFTVEALSRVLVVRAVSGRSLRELCVPTAETTREFWTNFLEIARSALRKVTRRGDR